MHNLTTHSKILCKYFGIQVSPLGPAHGRPSPYQTCTKYLIE